jgi:hypothetical protein
MSEHEFQQVRVLVETAERVFRGYLSRPLQDSPLRLSDYLNRYDRPFLCLSDVMVNERGQVHRPSERREFVAIAVAAISYLTPMGESEP